MNLLDLIISVAVNDSNAQNSLNQLNERAEGVGSKFKTVGLGIAKFGAVAAVGISGAVAAVGALAAPLVQAAASAQAMEAQFAAVFGKMSAEAEVTVDTLGDKFGMLPNRILPAFTQMTSLFKGLGLDTAEAAKAAEQAVTVTADAAAFYDKSFEDANGALNSFIKGNYEGGESIGLFGSAATMATYASEKLGKDWKTLDEAGKQLVRLDFAEAMQESAGATGQAARESNSLENQLGNLKQSWEDIKAKFGAPILEPAVSMIGKLASVITNFDTEPIIAKFKVFAGFIDTHVVSKFKEMQPQIANAISNVKGVFDTFVAFAISAFSKFTEIKPIIVDVIGNIRDVFVGFVDFAKGIFTGDGNVGESFVRIFNVVKTVALPILEDAISFIKSTLNKLKKFWDENGQQISDAVKNIWSGIAAIFEFFLPAIQSVVSDVWNAIKNIISGALDIIMGVVKTFSGLFTGDFDKMWEGIKQVFGGALDLIWGLLSVSFYGRIMAIIKGFGGQAVDVIAGMGTKMKDKFSDLVSSATEKFNSVKDAIMTPINYAKDKVKEAIDTIKGYFDKLKLKLPDIKTPSFKLKNWSANPKDWLDAMPSIGVSWNAKGGVFNKPTLFKTAGGFQGVGESGAELIAPLDKNTFEGIANPVSHLVVKAIDDMFGKVKNGISIVNNIYSNKIDEITLARQERKQLEKLGGAWR